MGVLNVTPDSFSDGGRHVDPAVAVDAAVAMEADGVAVIDVGAVSARPGAAGLSPDEEWARLEPVLGPLREATSVPLSLETTHPEVLDRALEVGVDLLNEITAAADPRLLAVAGAADLPVAIMHTRGTPETMQDDPSYADVEAEVRAELLAAADRAVDAGVARGSILLDPGIGFAKRQEDNLELLGGLPRLCDWGYPILLGCSRKSFLGRITGREVHEREHATTATTVWGALCGASLIRVHDVRAAVDALAVVAAITEARGAVVPFVTDR